MTQTLPPPHFNGGPGIHSRDFLGIKDARMRVVEHLGHKNQHPQEPGFSVSYNCLQCFDAVGWAPGRASDL